MMNLVHVCYGDRYWSKIIHGTIPIPLYDTKVKVISLKFLCKCFVFNVSFCKIFDGFDS